MECRGGDCEKHPMVGDSGSCKKDPIFEEGEYHPIVVEAVVEAVRAEGPSGQGEGQKKKRKRNVDHGRLRLVRLRAHINAIIRHKWMM
ncbi:hypothetical protein R1flu_024521 [Riccia fluitans]|uniref:Uncharacterized protein n=1 Tax=Riccia fluitans TaxID=41844 RepID=A0ABD1XV55_9MARC